MKISQLTPEQKTRLLDELAKEMRFYGNLWADGITDWFQYNAIISLVQKLPIEIKKKVVNQLYGTIGSFEGFGLRVLESTQSQLCDAVLVATGKAEI